MTLLPNQAAWSTKIVIVDDDLVSSLILERVLKGEGLHVLKASNGPDGRALVKAEDPDLVLLDVQMPGESGLEACQLLKADPATVDIPVIFLTGTGDMVTKLEGFRAGAADYITKPFQSEEVLARLHVHVRARKATRLLANSQIAQLDRLGSAMQAILADPAALPQAHYAVMHSPLRVAGGDFYEVLQAGDQIFDYVVADVSGHDADASLVTSALKVLLYQGSSILNSPVDSIRMINQAIFQTFPEATYLSLAWLRLNWNRNQASLFLAGHPQALHISEHGSEFVGTAGDVVGGFSHIEVDEYSFSVKRGDRILLYTDGLIESSQDGEAIARAQGSERLQFACLASIHLGLAEQLQAVTQALVGPAETRQDDILLLGVEVP